MFDKLKNWWADDWHLFPRLCRDLAAWFAGGQNVRVGLWTMSYDYSTNTYHHDYTRVAKRDLPPAAVHVTGKGNKEFGLDLDDSGPWAQPGDFNASDAYIIAKTYVCDVDAILTKKKNEIDGRTLGLIIAGLLGVAVVWIVFKVIL